MDVVRDLVKGLFTSFVLPRLEEEFGKHIPGEVFADVSAALFLVLSGQPLLTVTKATVLATVDNAIRDYKERV